MKPLGILKNGREGALARTFRHIGARDAWSIQLLLFFLYTISLISFLTDTVLLQKFDPVWFLVSGAGFLPPIAIVFIYKVGYLNRRPEKSRPIFNLIVAALAGSSRNFSVGLFAYWAGLDNSQLWAFRFFGGMVIGLAIFILWSLSQGASTEYASSLRRLSELQSDLAATRKEMPEILIEVNEKLQNRTKSSVLPQLESITKALGETRSSEAAVSNLRGTLSNVIRPILDEIADEAPKPFQPRNIKAFRKVKSTLPEKYRVYESISITGAALVQSIGYGFWLTFINGVDGVISTLLSMLIYGTCLWSAKLLIPRNREFSKTLATLITMLVGAFASAITVLYLANTVMSPVYFSVIAGVTLFSGILAPVILAHTNARHKRQKEIESTISDELRVIAKENSLFAQKVWVFRKRWLLVLHGTVQSALTAAVARLQSAKEVDEFTIQMVNQDLNRAQKAITEDTLVTINFEAAMSELVDVWKGICNVSVDLSERAKRALQRNADSAFCVNEIAKEAVSNAVRHGAAAETRIEIDRIEDDVLHIEITNDGIPPRSKEKSGIGSSMLDEICINWLLTTRSKKVCLVADLPVAI